MEGSSRRFLAAYSWSTPRNSWSASLRWTVVSECVCKQQTNSESGEPPKQHTSHTYIKHTHLPTHKLLISTQPHHTTYNLHIHSSHTYVLTPTPQPHIHSHTTHHTHTSTHTPQPHIHSHTTHHTHTSTHTPHTTPTHPLTHHTPHPHIHSHAHTTLLTHCASCVASMAADMSPQRRQ